MYNAESRLESSLEAVGLDIVVLDCDVLEVRLLKVVGVLVVLDMSEEAGFVVIAIPTVAAVAVLTSKKMLTKLIRHGEVMVIIIQA